MRDKLQTLKIIHVSLVIGLLLAYFILGDLMNLENLKMPTIDSSSIVYLIIPVFAVLASGFMFKSLVSKIDSKLDFDAKIAPYQTASIIRWAILEGAAFLILLLKPDFLIFGLLIIVYFILIRPTKSRMENDLNKLSTK